jgi:hypothetical protein
MKRLFLICIAASGGIGMAPPLKAAAIHFTLLGNPNQNYPFTRSDSPSGATVREAAGPYLGYLGARAPENLYAFLCMDYLKTANWNTSYSGFVYSVADAIPGKTQAQVVEAAYLVSKLMSLGGSAASTSVYKGPISFAVWQLMDPVAGHVPVDPAAQRYVLEAQNMYQSGSISAVSFPHARIFVPNNPSIQSFLTSSAEDFTSEVPEPATLACAAIGVALIGIGGWKKTRAENRNAQREP